MCGIAGIWLDQPARVTRELLTRMSDVIGHRGPDGSGVWCSQDEKVWFAHRRLAIVDLSEYGAQPMTSRTARFTISFNGEIYNFRQLRQELEGRDHVFKGHSDTEVALASFEQWGVEAAVRKFNGMFALAVWDDTKQILSLVRDRFGKKPIYLMVAKNSIVFASELKSLLVARRSSLQIDRAALTSFLQLGYVGGNSSILEGVEKVPPGQIVHLRHQSSGFVRAESTYWSASEVVATANNSMFVGSVPAAKAELSEVLSAAVRDRLVADVPLGAFLSGGIDSSIVVALMQRQSARPVKTFSVGFSEAAFDESADAQAVASHLGTDHTTLVMEPQMAIDAIPELPTIFDEPFADASQLPTYIIAKLAREHVTVALTGDGGDEVFGGYNRYVWWATMQPKLNRLPMAVRRCMARIVASAAHNPRMARAIAPAVNLLPRRARRRDVFELLTKISDSLGAADNVAAYYHDRLVRWPAASTALLGSHVTTSFGTHLVTGNDTGPAAATKAMMLADAQGYLVDDVLVKVDRATMAASLEARCPLLDHRVFEFAARLPLEAKVGGGGSKIILRSLLYDFVPRDLVDRPKRGFSVPLRGWLVGPLRPWAEHMLDDRRMREDGYINPRIVRPLWDQLIAGRTASTDAIWHVLMFQAWMDRWRKLLSLSPAI